MMDYPDTQQYTVQATAGGTSSGYVTTDVDFDTNWHTYGIYRAEGGTAEFQVDAQVLETLGPPNVPTTIMRPWLMSYARTPATESRFEVDWIRLRQYCGMEHESWVGPLDSSPTAATLASLNAAPKGRGIEITWETATELQTEGFHLYRSEGITDTMTQLNDELIPSQMPGSPTGTLYSYLDEGVIPGNVYFYWLSNVDLYGNNSLHGPVSARAMHALYLPVVTRSTP